MGRLGLAHGGGDEVVLTVPAAAVDRMGWPHTPLLLFVRGHPPCSPLAAGRHEMCCPNGMIAAAFLTHGHGRQRGHGQPSEGRRLMEPRGQAGGAHG